ncbi:hypothetical protein ATANTOWER_032019, partial [Ataeniobius toweri]|nr:hypothetical protein [Ataeniobius toweri]
EQGKIVHFRGGLENQQWVNVCLKEARMMFSPTFSSIDMRAPRPFPHCTHTMAVTRAIVAVLCVLFVCPGVPKPPTPPPYVSMRHVRNAAGHVGGRKKGREARKGQE